MKRLVTVVAWMAWACVLGPVKWVLTWTVVLVTSSVRGLIKDNPFDAMAHFIVALAMAFLMYLPMAISPDLPHGSVCTVYLCHVMWAAGHLVGHTLIGAGVLGRIPSPWRWCAKGERFSIRSPSPGGYLGMLLGLAPAFSVTAEEIPGDATTGAPSRVRWCQLDHGMSAGYIYFPVLFGAILGAMFDWNGPARWRGRPAYRMMRPAVPMHEQYGSDYIPDGAAGPPRETMV